MNYPIQDDIHQVTTDDQNASDSLTMPITNGDTPAALFTNGDQLAANIPMPYKALHVELEPTS